jgi:hypothetical protein
MRRIFALFLLFTAVSLRAGCGLEYCPFPGAETPWEAEASVRSARFDWEGRSGSYLQTQVRGLRRGPLWSSGALLSLVSLDEGGRRNTGLGSPLLFIERRLSSSFVSGLQAELPGGNHRMGVASEHAELLPYLSYHRMPEPFYHSALLGFRFSTDTGHAHAPAAGRPLLVNPHDDKEVLYRLALGWRLEGSSVKNEFFLDGAHALSSTAPGPGFVAAGVSLLFPAGGSDGFRFTAEQAVTRPRRFENRLGLLYRLSL